MQVAGTTSWAISVDQPLMLLLALYFRDPSRDRARKQWEAWWQQLLLGGGFWPEHLDPHDLGSNMHDPEVEKLFYWPDRYAGPDFPGLNDSPELQAVARQHYAAAIEWTNARKREWIALETARRDAGRVAEIVGSVERGLGRAVRPFRLDIRVVPMPGREVWRAEPNRALMTLELYRDEAAYEDWLQIVIQELA